MNLDIDVEGEVERNEAGVRAKRGHIAASRSLRCRPGFV